MATIEKVTLRDLSSIGHIYQAILKRIESTLTAQDLHLVYDCYLRHPSREYERMGRVEVYAPLEYVDLSMTSAISVQIDCFWSCSKNMGNIQV